MRAWTDGFLLRDLPWRRDLTGHIAALRRFRPTFGWRGPGTLSSCWRWLSLLPGFTGGGMAGRAVLTLAVIFVSPLCALSSALFSARVVHHVLLISVAAPLLAGLLPEGRRPEPGIAFVVAAGILWVWHLPVACDAALGNMLMYWMMQASLLGSWVLFWQAVFSRVRSAPAAALLLIFAGYVQMALLGVLLTLAPDALYALHQIAPMDWGMTPLTDQQLGGLIMWMPAGLPFVAIGALIGWRAWSMMQAADGT